MKELLVEGIQLEEFGGDVPSVQVSGLTGHGLPELIETISALAEMADLRSARDGVVHGHVLESRVQRGMGAVATVLVARGCLKPGMNLVCGTTTARVRAMADSAGKPVKAAYPGDAVTVAGWREVPAAGDDAISCTEAEGKKALTNRVRKREQEQQLKDVEAINAARRVERDLREAEERATAAGKDFIPEKVVEDDGRKLLKLVIKGDVSGSVEAVAGALEGIGNDIAGVKIISTGVGDVTETDVQLASTAQGRFYFHQLQLRMLNQLRRRDRCLLCWRTTLF
jgi:translation initiation factor IF-2